VTVPRASIIVLTHDRPTLLGHAVASALAQTVSDLEVLILGDGATEGVRAAANLLAVDPRVRFLDYPKGPHRGEAHRDTAIREASSNAVFYLCDDDLLLPRHVESLLDLLETHVFAQSANCWVDGDGAVRPYAADLSSPMTIAWHVREDVTHNAVSITGTAHRRDFYLDAARPWSTTPTGVWPDLYQWRKMFTASGFSAETSARVTALQFPNAGSHRANWTEEQHVAELETWEALIAQPDGQEQIERMLLTGALRELEHEHFAHEESKMLVAVLESSLEQTRASTSWRVTAPLRALSRLARRRRRKHNT
jgi:hypothetical protein